MECTNRFPSFSRFEQVLGSLGTEHLEGGVFRPKTVPRRPFHNGGGGRGGGSLFPCTLPVASIRPQRPSHRRVPARHCLNRCSNRR